MKKIILVAICMHAFQLFAQPIANCGMDNDPTLTKTESVFLNEYLNKNEQQKIDFSDKKIMFITGSNGSTIGNKVAYFDNVKAWNEKGDKISSWAIPLTEKEKKETGGYDLIVTYWVKIFTERSKKNVVKNLKKSI